MTAHRYTVERTVLRDNKGNPLRLSDYWRIVCRDCSWRGERIADPGSRESKDRMEKWGDHVRDSQKADHETN